MFVGLRSKQYVDDFRIPIEILFLPLVSASTSPMCGQMLGVIAIRVRFCAFDQPGSAHSWKYLAGLGLSGIPIGKLTVCLLSNSMAVTFIRYYPQDRTLSSKR
ncbi:hypothetical protein EDD17DRAFT_37771 [Pisolithus thermaeus]|nr:hypothetical protein EDD17DRAFT_37771 [Pisolithus thermaeus]